MIKISIEEAATILRIAGNQLPSADGGFVVDCAKLCNRLSDKVDKHNARRNIEDLFAYIAFTNQLEVDRRFEYSLLIKWPAYCGIRDQGTFRVLFVEGDWIITASGWWGDVIEEQVGNPGDYPSEYVKQWIFSDVSEIRAIINRVDSVLSNGSYLNLS